MLTSKILHRILHAKPSPKPELADPTEYHIMRGGAGFIAYKGRKAVWETTSMLAMRKWFNHNGFRCPNVTPIRIAVYK